MNGSDAPEPIQIVHRLALNTPPDYLFDWQIGVTQPKGTKNLAPKNIRGKSMTTIEEADISKQCTDPTHTQTKAKIVAYSFWMLKEGYAESTIISRTKLLKILAKRGANILDPESVKETIARQKCWSEEENPTP